MKTFFCAVAVVAVLAAATATRAQTINLTANDASGSSSYNAAGSWSPAGAPSAGNNYNTQGYLLRGPASGAGPITFLGNSLTVGAGSSANAFSPITPGNDALIFKLNGQTLNVNNLILDGGSIRDGNGSGNQATITGNISVTINGAGFQAQDSNIIASAISGPSAATITIGSTGADASLTRWIIFTSSNNTFNGNVTVNSGNGNAAQAEWALNPGSLWNFNIGATAGANNLVNGVAGTTEFWGNWNLNITGASDVTPGDVFPLVSPNSGSYTSLYESAFNINGATQEGNTGIWDDYANSVDYQYNEATGDLTIIPEPSTFALIGAGLGFGVMLLRRKSNRA